MEQEEIIVYQPNESLRLEVRLDGDDVWLNRLQLAELFDHNVPVVAKFATTVADGKVHAEQAQSKCVSHYLYTKNFETNAT